MASRSPGPAQTPSRPRPDPIQAPPRPRPSRCLCEGTPGGLCFPAQRVIGLHYWTGRKDWVGLPTAREVTSGRDLDGRGLGYRPLPRSQSGQQQQGRGQNTAAGLNAALWIPLQSSAPEGQRRYWRPRGRLGLGQGGGCWGTQRALGVMASTELPPAGSGPCLRPRLRLPAAKPAAAGRIGACPASCPGTRPVRRAQAGGPEGN